MAYSGCVFALGKFGRIKEKKINIKQWVTAQGFQPKWLIGKKVRLVKFNRFAENDVEILSDNSIVSKINDSIINFTNGDRLEISENTKLIFNYRIQIYDEI